MHAFLDPDSFQSVMSHTTYEDGRLSILAKAMPQGRGLQLACEDKPNASVLDQWHRAVKGAYEQQEKQRAEEVRRQNTSGRAGQEKDEATRKPRGGNRATKLHLPDIEAKLQEDRAEALERVGVLEAEIAERQVECRELDRFIVQVGLALEALAPNDDDSRDTREPHPSE